MILLDHVNKTYPGDAEPALDSVSLHIEPHEFVFLVGKSGAGKSTLIKMITKEEVPDSGKIIIGGIDLDFVKRRHIPTYRQRLGVVFQDFKLLPTRTVFENVAFALEIAGMSNREIHKTVPKVLDLVGLGNKANRFPSHLSGGEQQRVSIARSVARQPKILIADEPTGNLDKLTRQEIIDLLQKINDFGTTILVTTHDENIVNDLGKRVITLKYGAIVSDQKDNGVYRLDGSKDTDTKPQILTPGARYQRPTQPTSVTTPASTPKPLAQAAVNSAPASVTKSATARTTTAARSTATTAPTARTLQKSTSIRRPLRATTNQALTNQPAARRRTSSQDAANRWYTASQPVQAAPRLSTLKNTRVPNSRLSELDKINQLPPTRTRTTKRSSDQLPPTKQGTK